MEDNWEIGDIAICINNGDLTNHSYNNPPLKLYSEHIVNAINICSCGSIALDVGLSSQRQGTICSKCGSIRTDSSVHWCHASRFVKKKTKQMVQMELNAAVEAENYELAQEINERLKSM